MTKADDRKGLEDTALDGFFAAARDATPPMPEGLATRIAAQGRALLPAPAPTRLGAPLAILLRQFGGWPTIAGLAAASVTGLAIGISAPDLLSVPFDDGAAYDLGDLMPGYGVILGEGVEG